MRLGKKKEKGGEQEVGRTQTVDGVARLICSAKSSHNQPLKGTHLPTYLRFSKQKKGK